MGTEAAAPALRLYAAWHTKRHPTPPTDWRRVVILGSAHIGDVLYRTASLPHLRRALPNARITYVCAPLTAEILATDPNVDEVLPLVTADRVWRGSPAARAALHARALDAVLCTDHIDYGGDLLFAVRLGIPNRAGFVHKGWSGLVTFPVRPAVRQPAPAFFRDMVAQLAGVPPVWDLRPRITLTPDDRAQAEGAVRELAIGASRRIIACAVTSRQPDPVWPVERYRRAVEICGAEQGDVDVVFCGSASDAPVLGRMATACTLPAHVLAGRLGLRAFAAFLARCDALLTADSGPRHLANAVGTPVVFTRRLAVAAAEVGPYCDTEIDVAPPGEYLSRAAQMAALATLEPRTVAQALSRVLRPRAEPRPGPS